MAKRCAQRLADELGLPSYLYEAACEKGSYRQTLTQLRAGEYEALETKLKDPKWAPCVLLFSASCSALRYGISSLVHSFFSLDRDYGPTTFCPKWGVGAVGARFFLIAYNVNILGTKEQAHRIALNLREQGRKEEKKDDVSATVSPNPSPPPVPTAGEDMTLKERRLRCVKAIGWYLDEQNIAQISINLTNYQITGMQHVYEEARKDAAAMQVAVAGSELVGLVPLGALMQAADYYCQKEGLMILDEKQKVLFLDSRASVST